LQFLRVGDVCTLERNCFKSLILDNLKKFLGLPFPTRGVSPTPGRLTFLDFAMFLNLCSSFLATRSRLSSMAFSKGSTVEFSPPLKKKNHE